MKKLRTLAFCIELFIGCLALISGWELMIHPDGSNLNLSTDLVKNTPLSSFAIPGLLLAVIIGPASILTALMILFRMKRYTLFIVIQGVLLVIWITSQVFLFDQINPIQESFLLIGITLFLCGVALTILETDADSILKRPIKHHS